MASISSGTGIISGLDTTSIIEQLMSIESRGKTKLEARVKDANTRKVAYTDLSARLTSIKLSGTALKKPQTFRSSKATSSDENALTATTAVGAAAGTYQVRVARLVSSSQAISQGFSDYDKTKLGVGSMTLELGGGGLKADNNLADLNGGAGVRRGLFRIRDRSGATALIDTSDAISINDVVNKINTALGVSVRADLDGDRLKLTDLTGKTANGLTVQDVSASGAAKDLGIETASSGTTINGTSIQKLGSLTTLTTLNDGLGVRRNTADPDFRITAPGGATFDISLGTASTLADVFKTIEAATGGAITASVDTSGRSIALKSVAAGSITVTALNASKSAADLGIVGTGTGSILRGSSLLSDMGTVSLKSLKGGAGLALGRISIKNRNNVTTQIDLAASTGVQDMLNRINNANAGVRAQLKASGNGIEIVDTTGAANSLVIGDVNGTGAAQLGINGTFTTATSTVRGANLQRKWMAENTLLKGFSGGRDVVAGTIKLTNSTGAATEVEITDADLTLGDVINKINAKNGGIVASINANGDGMLLTDTAGGALAVKAEDTNSTTAKLLNITSLATEGGKVINGSFEKTIDIVADDTLSTLQNKINDLSFGATAAIINDGSAGSPYRMSLAGTGSGNRSNVSLDTGKAELEMRTLVTAHDAAVFVGGESGSQPMLVTAASNSVSGVIRGVTMQLNGVTDKAVTLNVSRNVDNVVEEIGKFVTSYNELSVKIAEYSKFDSETNERGTLLGEGALLSTQTQVAALFTNAIISEGGSYRIAADVGMKIGSDGELTFDEQRFRTAYSDDPEGVMALFTKADKALTTDTQLPTLKNNRGVRTAGAGKADFAISLRDGTAFNVTLNNVNTLGNVIDAINTSAAGKMTATINDAGTGLILTDATAGASSFGVASLNGSSASFDLGLSSRGIGGVISGSELVSVNAIGNGGLGSLIEKRVNKLIDPVNGIITRANKEIDSQNETFTDRIADMEKVLDSKKTRLQRQFATLESTLAKLQTQQSALGNFQPISASSK